MATGYTIELLNGNINSLEEFAKLCVKAFGSTQHQQDEPLNTPLRKAVVGKENKKAIRVLKKSIKEFDELTDKQLIEDERKALKQARVDHLSRIVKIKDAKKKLTDLLRETQIWTPPTEKHNNLKEFMISELKDSIEKDCNVQPVNELIEDIDGRLSTIDPKKIRKIHIDALNQKMDIHIERQKYDEDHVAQSNKWVGELIESFK